MPPQKTSSIKGPENDKYRFDGRTLPKLSSCAKGATTLHFEQVLANITTILEHLHKFRKQKTIKAVVKPASTLEGCASNRLDGLMTARKYSTWF